MATTTSSAQMRRIADQRAITPALRGRGFTTPTAVPPTGHTINGVPIPKAITPRVAVAPAPVTTTSGATRIIRFKWGGVAVHPDPGVVMVRAGGTAGGMSPATGGYDNALSGDLLSRLGLSLPRALEIVAFALAIVLAWRYVGRK